MSHGELHGSVNVFASGDAFVEEQDGLVEHRTEEAVGNESWSVLGGDDALAQLLFDELDDARKDIW